MAQHQITIIARFIDNITKPIKKAFSEIDKFNSKVRGMRGGLMGVGFFAMFTGMALNRFINSAITSAINAYKIMGAEQTIFNVKTNELAAAWEFFKFSLIDALSQSELFVYLIDLVIQLINWFSGLSESEKFILALAIAFGSVSTKILSVLGNLSLLVVAIEGIKPGIITALAKAFWGVNAALLANPWTWIIIGIIAIILVIGYCIHTFSSLKSALKFFGMFAIWLFALIGDAIIESLVFPLRGLIALIDLAIKASNMLFGTKYRTLSERLPDYLQPGMLTRKAESYLFNASWTKEPQEDIAKNGTFKEYAFGLVSSLTENISDAVYSGMDKALVKHNVVTATPNT